MSEPAEEPFCPPDAWSGGARTVDAAYARAVEVAGMHLEPIDGRWAAAWMRLRAGLPPFVAPSSRPRVAATQIGPCAVLGVEPSATVDEIKAAFKRRAFVSHPDRGGSSADFIALKRAYDRLLTRRGVK